MYSDLTVVEHKKKSCRSHLMNIDTSFASEITLLTKFLVYNIEVAGDPELRS